MLAFFERIRETGHPILRVGRAGRFHFNIGRTITLVRRSATSHGGACMARRRHFAWPSWGCLCPNGRVQKNWSHWSKMSVTA